MYKRQICCCTSRRIRLILCRRLCTDLLVLLAKRCIVRKYAVTSVPPERAWCLVPLGVLTMVACFFCPFSFTPATLLPPPPLPPPLPPSAYRRHRVALSATGNDKPTAPTVPTVPAGIYNHQPTNRLERPTNHARIPVHPGQYSLFDMPIGLSIG